MKKFLIVSVPLTIALIGLFFFSQNARNQRITEKAIELEKTLRKEGPAYYNEYQHRIRTRSGMNQPTYQPGYRQIAFQKALQLNQDQVRLREPLPWIERGPGNVGGRTRGLIVDPRDSTHHTWYAGSVGGGVWKTEDAGQNWRHLTEDLSNLGTSILAASPAFPDILYCGTGEGYGSLSITGNGVWKSEDSGETWNQLSSTANDKRFGNIMRMVVNPDDVNELVICTRISVQAEGEEISFILVSEDGGQSWSEQFSFDENITQIITAPDDFNIMYGAIENVGVIKSVDAGRSWELIFDISDRAIGRLELAIAPQDANTVFFSAESFEVDLELFRSKNGGVSWNKIIPQGGGVDFGPVFSGQGWYDNTIAVHPYNPDIVFIGGAGPIVEIATTDDVIGSVRIRDIQNKTTFLELATLPGFNEEVLFAENVEEIFGAESTIERADYLSVELRFGLGNSQNAHRFLTESSISDNEFASFSNIPFQAWDLASERQLTVSFLDINGDGGWTVIQDETDFESMEAIVIHATPYQDSLDQEITENILHDAMYVLFPFREGRTSIPGGELQIVVSVPQSRAGILNVVVDGYDEYDEFPNVSTKGVHVDHHNLVFMPTDTATQQFIILNANDGGVAFSEDSGDSFLQTGDTFRDGIFGPFPTSSGYNTAQFYGVDKMNGGDRYVGGTQDNGSWISDFDPDATSSWDDAPSGDGFEAAWHYTDSLKILESSQFNVVYRSDDGGNRWRFLDLPGDGPFITRLANSKQDPELVFAVSRSGVLRSQDFGDSWEVISMPPRWRFSNFVPIEVSLASPNVVWTGDQMVNNSRLAVSVDGGFSFEVTENYELAEMGPITGIGTHPFEPGTAYALFSIADGPKILKTTDAGETWTDLSGFITNAEESSNGFPDVATYSLLVMPYDTNIIWVGTEIGLFESTDAGVSWHYADNGMPPAAIWEMKIVNDEVVLATHGRGVWSVALPELEDYVIPEALLAPNISFNGDGFDGRLVGDLNLRDSYDSTFIELEIEGFDDFFFRSDKLEANEVPIIQSFNLRVDNIPDDTILIADVKVIGYIEGTELISTAKVPIYDVDETAPPDYFNDFDMERADFARLGFNIYQEEDFENQALHSPHPYSGLQEHTSVLQTPILISPASSMLSFDEVVLVETGDSDIFGAEDFYDFVIVEATKDNGITWDTLAGYDSSDKDIWENAYVIGEDGSAELFQNRTIDLFDFYNEGDFVYLRFRLVSDPFVEGWGWAIDNLRIEGETVSTDEDILSEAFTYSVFPNPVKDRINVSLNVQNSGTLRMDLLGVTGRVIRNLLPPQRAFSGEQRFEYNLNDLSPGVYFLKIEVGEKRLVERIIVQ